MRNEINLFIPRDRYHIYLNKYFFTEIKYLQKRFMVKKTIKKSIALKLTFDLSHTGIL